MTAFQLRLRLFRIMTAGAVAGVLILVLGQQAIRAQEQPGFTPDFVPNGLGEGDFDQLGGNWADWADETGRLVTDFYTSDDDAVRGSRQTLEQIQGRLNTMERALSDARYLPIYGPLADLHGRLSRRIAVTAALYDVIDQDVTKPAPSRVNSATSALASETRSLRSYLQSINGGPGWIDYLELDEVAKATGQAGTNADSLELIDGVHQKLADLAPYNEQQRQFLTRKPLVRFADALERVTQLLNVENPEQRQEELRNLAASLTDAIEDYEGEPSTENAQRLRQTYDEIRRLTPDGAAALTDAMRKHYFNYNLRLVIDESLARDVVHEAQSDSGFINERVSRAHVTGCQWTNATVDLDLKPSNNTVRFDLILNGNVRSSITGSTHLATVYTSGQYHFNGRKPVQFDGEHFATWPASVGVGGANRPYAARTRLSWIPLLGRIAENTALREAGSAENNQYARNKVYQQARSQFDRETADMLRQAERNLEQDVAGPLRTKGYYPDVKQLRSTESEAILRTRLMGAGELGGGDTLPLPIYPAHGALVQLHASLLNQVGERLQLEGKRFTPDGLEQYLKSEIEQITGRPFDLSGLTNPDNQASDSPKVEEIIFHDSDAVRFQITGGEVILNLSMGLKLEDRDEIEPQRISVPLQFSLAGDKIHMERGTVGVSPIGRVDPSDRVQQIARAGVMRQKIQEAFEPRDLNSSFDLTIENKTVTLHVTDLRARSGWLSVIATDGVSGPHSSGTVRTQPLQHVSLPVSSRRN